MFSSICSADSLLFPTKITVLFRSLWGLIPNRLLRYVEYLPTRENIRFRHTLKVVNRLSAKIIAEKTKARIQKKDEKERDMMSIFGMSAGDLDCTSQNDPATVKANASEHPSTRLSDKEMISLMATLMLGGAYRP